MPFFSKPKRRKLDQYVQGHRKDPELVLSEMTRLSNRVWRVVIGLLLTAALLAFLFPTRDWRQTVGLGVLVFLMNALGSAVLLQIRPGLFSRPASFNNFVALLLLTVGVSKAVFVLGYPFLAPLPFLAIVLTMLYGQAVALLVAVGVGFYLSLMSPRLMGVNFQPVVQKVQELIAGGKAGQGDLRVMLDPVFARADLVLGISLMGGALVTVIAIKKIRQQSLPTLIGGLAGLTQGLVVLAFSLVNPGFSVNQLTNWYQLRELLADPGWACLGGALSGAAVTIFLPLIERMLGIITERRLLALSDHDNELLKTLRNRAPGTYQHTLGVAQLASNAAEAIGVDALLTQVGAYYHDIGKIAKPEYFVENMGEDKSIHSRLKPSMSKLIIISHVKEGIELALEAKLPERLVDMIPMHHGTTVVEYFFHKALEESQAGAKSPESDTEYRYPGPRPRFPEAGVLMLADAVEAIAKSMPDPNTNRFRDAVNEVIRKRLLDGQLDECGLTIEDLRKIGDSFVRTLTTMYHGRIRYPSAGEDRDAGDSGTGGEAARLPAAGAEASAASAQKKSGEAGNSETGSGRAEVLVRSAPPDQD